MVLEALRHELMDPELFREFCAEFTRELNRLQSGESARRDGLVTELAQVERRLRRMVDAIAEGVPARTLKDELLALEGRQEELRAELDAAREPATTRLHPNLAELYRQKVAALHAALEDETLRDEAFELIRSLIEKVVRDARPNGQVRIDLHGELAGILEPCAETGRRGGRADELASQIKRGCGGRI